MGVRVAVVTALAASALTISAPSTAVASGPPTATDLAERGWTCFAPPSVPDLVGCFNPGTGRPFPGNPDPAPSYSVRLFDGWSGGFLHTAHLIRADLYRGQPCGVNPYNFLPLIGYYECVHP